MMADSENQKYCHIHGCPLIADNYCEKCRQKRNPGYIENELKERNKTPWIDNSWMKFGTDYISHCYMCHRCKYFMWHHLQYCYCCGGKLVQENLTKQELAEKYKDYRQGY